MEKKKNQPITSREGKSSIGEVIIKNSQIKPSTQLPSNTIENPPAAKPKGK
jgi:hypothetical protein